LVDAPVEVTKFQIHPVQLFQIPITVRRLDPLHIAHLLDVKGASSMSEPVSEAAQRSPAVQARSSAAEIATTSSAQQPDQTVDSGLEYVVLPNGHRRYRKGQDPRLRYQKPYWWPYKTFVKDRWIGRELLEVVSTEFRDRSVEYYVRRVPSHPALLTL
jgi:hypothetical protein